MNYPVYVFYTSGCQNHKWHRPCDPNTSSNLLSTLSNRPTRTAQRSLRCRCACSECMLIMCNYSGLSLHVGWNIWWIGDTSECFREPSSGRGSGFENLCPAPCSGSFELKFCSLEFWVVSFRTFKQANNTWNVTSLKTHGSIVGVLWLGKLIYVWVEWLKMPLHIWVEWWAIPLRIWIEC